MNISRLLPLVCLQFMAAFPAMADDVLPGLWSLTVSMTAAGLDNEIGPFTKTQCFTEADAQKPDKLFSEMGGKCTYGEKRFQGSRYTFKVMCDGVVPMQGEGEVSFSANAFEGSLEIQAEVSEIGPVKTKSRVTGSRLGDCKNIAH